MPERKHRITGADRTTTPPDKTGNAGSTNPQGSGENPPSCEPHATKQDAHQDYVHLPNSEPQNLLVHVTGGKAGMLYRFLDGSVAFFAWGAPSWQEAGEITGAALETALPVLEARGQPGGKHGWPPPQKHPPTPLQVPPRT